MALDELERIELVRRYHQRARLKMPNVRVHAAIHAIVENQVALGDQTPVAATVQRLMTEGLDRHEAIHAVGTAVANLLWAAGQKQQKRPDDPAGKYYEEVKKLTAQGWLKSGEE
jgi:uncharacterized protein YoaH (UPF0181 family)